jgi:predicted transcriptional regulator
VLMGLFLFSLARRTFQAQEWRLMLAALPAAAVMASPAPVLAAGAPMPDALSAVIVDGAPVAVVVDGDRAVGVVTAHAIADALVGAGAAHLTVGDAAFEPPSAMLVDAGESVETLVVRLVPDGPAALLVIERGRVLGIVTRESVGARLLEAGVRAPA